MNTIATASMPAARAAESSRAQRGEVRLALDGSVGTHALVHFEDALVEHFRLDDVAGKDLRPRLVADLEGVAKTLGDDEERALALALEQRIGRDRGAHFHFADHAGGIGSPALTPMRSRMPCTAASP